MVSNQIDLRNDPSIIKKLAENNQKPVTFQEAEKLAKEIGAVKYVECSALSKERLKNVFEETARIATEVKHRPILLLML